MTHPKRGPHNRRYSESPATFAERALRSDGPTPSRRGEGQAVPGTSDNSGWAQLGKLHAHLFASRGG